MEALDEEAEMEAGGEDSDLEQDINDDMCHNDSDLVSRHVSLECFPSLLKVNNLIPVYDDEADVCPSMCEDDHHINCLI